VSVKLYLKTQKDDFGLLVETEMLTPLQVGSDLIDMIASEGLANNLGIPDSGAPVGGYGDPFITDAVGAWFDCAYGISLF
jgi:hypothetical protein